MKDFGNQQNSQNKKEKNAKKNPTKEEIINQAFSYHSKGQIAQAAKYYQHFINQGFNDHRVFSNFGAILKDLGKPQEAELSTRKAIELNPNYAMAHSNLGGILKDLGKPQEALDSYLKVIEINPKLSNVYNLTTTLLKDSDPSQFNKSKLKDILNLLLERKDVPHKELFRAFNFLCKEEIINNLEKSDSTSSKNKLFTNDKLIIHAIKKIIFTDVQLEELLTKVRTNMCNRIAKNIESINQSELEFIIALAEQCFLNEYIYSFTKEERLATDTIINRCIHGEINVTSISILSCYFPLYKLINQIPYLKSFKSQNQSFQELKKLQLSEPIKEIKLSQNIRSLGQINDHISQKVRSQYEENPYPRWRYTGDLGSQDISFLTAINNDINPNSISKSLFDEQIKVLIAGCGTGQQILHTQRYKNAQVTAIDLSLSSLSYAQRKIKELEIKNVKLIQMDILEVDLLVEEFDVIECGGVLHHMNDPSKGLNALLGILKNNGFLKLGLYSELARQPIVEARNYIASKKLQANEDNIRNFRETVFSGKAPLTNFPTQSPDFYTLSSCRDLCFHTKEHRFTIDQIQTTLKSNELEFLGFLLPKPVRSIYKNYFPEDKAQTNLQNWKRFEEKYPQTFSRMYQFWVSKM